MQQPPLSIRIRALEKRLDVPLFRRKARGVDLTDRTDVVSYARTLLDHTSRRSSPRSAQYAVNCADYE
jgi:DNA-binding transcriptional LysR family regulator